MKPCINYKIIDAEILKCETCSHFCLIKQGRVGLCGVRQNLDNQLFLLPYGKAAAIGIDPIEKKPLFHFLPGSMVYSFGTLGCNFKCANCQNYGIAQIRRSDNINWGRNLPPEEIIKQALANDCRGIAYTYNEPTIFLEYALDTMKLARAKNLKNIWVSNGFMSDKTLDAILPYLDAINVDIKSFSDNFYKSNCGARLEPILKNCRRLAEAGVWLEITTLVIPTLSDDEKMLRRIAEFIKKELGEFTPWHLSAFSGAISWKLKHLPDTTEAAIKKAFKIGKEAGLKYVYAGNIKSGQMENTYCHKCGEIVIKRRGYNVTRLDQAGSCKNCQEKMIIYNA